MHINVSDILAQGEGSRTSFNIVDETIELEDIPMAEKINGQVTIGRTEDCLSLDGEARTAVILECHRCLREFTLAEELKLRGEFSREPNEDQWPITKEHTIDIQPLIVQEIVLGIPIKQLCKPDCPGLDPDTGEPLEEATK